MLRADNLKSEHFVLSVLYHLSNYYHLSSTSYDDGTPFTMAKSLLIYPSTIIIDYYMLHIHIVILYCIRI